MNLHESSCHPYSICSTYLDVDATTFCTTMGPCHGPSCVLLMAGEEAKLLPIFLLEISIAAVKQVQQDWQQHNDHKRHYHSHAGGWVGVRHRHRAHVKYHHHPKQQHAVQQIAGHASPWLEKGDSNQVDLGGRANPQKSAPFCLIWIMETLYLWYPASPESQKVLYHVFYQTFPFPLQLLAAVSFCRAKSYLSSETKTVPSEFLHCTHTHTHI